MWYCTPETSWLICLRYSQRWLTAPTTLWIQQPQVYRASCVLTEEGKIYWGCKISPWFPIRDKIQDYPRAMQNSQMRCGSIPPSPIFNTDVHTVITGLLQTAKSNEIHLKKEGIYQRNHLLLPLRTLGGQSRRGRTQHADLKMGEAKEKEQASWSCSLISVPRSVLGKKKKVKSSTDLFTAFGKWKAVLRTNNSEQYN